MIHNVSSTPARTLEKPVVAPKTESPDPTPPPPQDSLEPGFLRKAGGVVAAAGAGSAGLVYGGIRGLMHGAGEVPQTTLQGGKIGTKVVEPLTRTAGAVVASAFTGVAGAAAVAAAAAGPVGGLMVGTLHGAVEKGDMVKGAVRTAAEGGVRVGSAVLGAVGGALGALVGLCTLPSILYPPFGMKVIPQAVRACASGGFAAGSKVGQYVGGGVGGALGAVGGGAAAVATSLPQGLQAGAQVGKATLQNLKEFPQVAKNLWNSGQSAGKFLAQASGGTVGVVAGAATGVVASGGYALVGGVEYAGEWAGEAYQKIAGKPQE
jgi:hypothetical protein